MAKGNLNSRTANLTLDDFDYMAQKFSGARAILDVCRALAVQECWDEIESDSMPDALWEAQRMIDDAEKRFTKITEQFSSEQRTER